MSWDPKDKQGNESAKIKWEIVRYTRGTVLDIGAGTVKPWPHFISVDQKKENDFTSLMVDIKRDARNLAIFASNSIDAVFSSHLLEHLEDTASVLREWWRVVKPGGHLVLYLPHKDLYPNIGQPGHNPDHKHDFLPEDIVAVMERLGGWDLVRNEVRDQDKEYSFFQVYRKRTDRKQTHPWKDPKPEKTAAVVRYGGFGDMIQTSSVLPHLKEAGYHVTLYTNEGGRDVLRFDPHVDEFYVQDKDQVPLEQLHLFFQNERKKYDLFVNLTETVETTLLPTSGMSAYFWPKEARHQFCNHNYLEFMHRIAGVPPVFRQKFYPTPKEEDWARRQKAKMGGQVILWSVAGSSVHKVWPWMDNAWARIFLSLPDWKIVATGGDQDTFLTYPWKNEPRLIDTCGKWSIRETLAFVKHADIVVGPETGVMNAAGLLPVPKILFLSHSTVENVSKHWKNCISLEPQGCDCYPCHKLHLFEKNDCPRDEETGTTACQARISLEAFFSALTTQLKTLSVNERAA